ncbi:hypothetical protein [Pseudooceanicola nitratireducens]|jgi:hypothetical protein|uniref:hypothetical protein n=1 Tax=Pseudooceanicola nitratireducens TaxID=517719 RepID=UPI003C7AF332
MPNMHHAFDARLEHRALGLAALTAATVLDTITQRAQQRKAYRTLVNLEAIKISANDESYQLVVEVSNDDFSTTEVAAIVDLGATEVRQSGAPDSEAGDSYEVMWTTEQNGVKYEKARLKLFTAGTSPSITLGCYSTVLGNV